MRNVIGVLLAASAVGLLAWYFMGPDRQIGTPAVEAQMESAVATDEADAVEMAATEEASDEAAIVATEQATMVEEEEVSIATVLTTRADEIVSIYENAPWVHEGLTGPVLYVISFRSCSSCLAFKEAELHGLEEAGVDVRWIIYTRRDRPERARSLPEERAVQAELWLNRDWDLFKEWYAVDPGTYYETAELPVAAETSEERLAAVNEARDLVDQLSDLYEANDVDLYIPSLLWQQDGEWVTYVGYEETSFAPVREALTGTY